jgi:hypothetical protein
MRSLMLLALVPLAAGCNVHSKNPAKGDETVSIKAKDNGEVTFNVPFASGQVKLPEGAMGHSSFDIDGAKLPPGSSVTGVSVFAKDEGADVTIAFKASMAPDQVRSYFLDQFKAKGVEASASSDGITGKSKDGSQFVIHLQPAGTGSHGKVEVHSKA